MHASYSIVGASIYFCTLDWLFASAVEIDSRLSRRLTPVVNKDGIAALGRSRTVLLIKLTYLLLEKRKLRFQLNNQLFLLHELTLCRV